jgi:hypothetical protein
MRKLTLSLLVAGIMAVTFGGPVQAQGRGEETADCASSAGGRDAAACKKPAPGKP